MLQQYNQEKESNENHGPSLMRNNFIQSRNKIGLNKAQIARTNNGSMDNENNKNQFKNEKKLDLKKKNR